MSHPVGLNDVAVCVCVRVRVHTANTRESVLPDMSLLTVAMFDVQD